MTRQSASLLPYVHLNLRRNPFGEFSQDESAALADVEIDPIVDRLVDRAFAVQFVGEKGYGKTTHLLALGARFPEAAYLHIAEGEHGQIPLGCPLLIDEAQRLSRWQRRKVFRSQVPLVLGTHHDFWKELTKAGRRVETIHVAQGTGRDRLHRLLGARIEWVRRHNGPVPSISRATTSRLITKFGPNIRGILHDLYGTFQELTQIREV